MLMAAVHIFQNISSYIAGDCAYALIVRSALIIVAATFGRSTTLSRSTVGVWPPLPGCQHHATSPQRARARAPSLNLCSAVSASREEVQSKPTDRQKNMIRSSVRSAVRVVASGLRPVRRAFVSRGADGEAVRKVGIIGVPFDKGQTVNSVFHEGPKAIRDGGLIAKIVEFNGW